MADAPAPPLLMFDATAAAAAWNLQGDPADETFMSFAARRFGLNLPVVRNTSSGGADWNALWLSPRSWLLTSRRASSAAEFRRTRDEATTARGAVFDVSHGRVVFQLAGPTAAEVLAVGCPLDFGSAAFGPGTCRQSVYGRIGVLVHQLDGTPTYAVYVARSFAADAWRALAGAAARAGIAVQPLPDVDWAPSIWN